MLNHLQLPGAGFLPYAWFIYSPLNFYLCPTEKEEGLFVVLDGAAIAAVKPALKGECIYPGEE